MGEAGLIGLNAPADMRLAPQFFAMLGARWIRVVLLPDVDLTPWITDAHRRGLKVLGVIARESIWGADESIEPWPMDQWLGSLRVASGVPIASVALGHNAVSYNVSAEMYANRYGDTFDAIQCGNEADHISPSSWTMTPDDLNSLLAAFNQALPNTTIVGPGLVSGDPHYLDGVDLDLVDAIAVHPYGQRPDNGDWNDLPGNFGSVANLLDSYRYHNRPIWITEVGVSTTQVSHAFQARYTEAMLKALKLRTDVPVVTWFCADDAMVEEFGLYDIDGRPKIAATSFMKVAGPITQPEPDPMPDVNVHAIDVADYQPRDLTQVIQAYKPDHVIVHLYMPGEGKGPQWSRDQINSARDNGCSVGGYVYPYRPTDDVDWYFTNTLELCASVNLQLPVCWPDCEYVNPTWPGPDEAWLDHWFSLCDSVQMLSGPYCNLDWLQQHPWMMKYGQQGRPLWLAHHHGVADITAEPVPAGWAQIAALQWEVSQTPWGYGLDRDVIRPEYTVYAGSEPPPPPDPCENLKRQLEAWRDAKPYKAPTKAKLKALLA